MKRYVCTVAVGFVLALMGTATASANDLLPAPGQEATQVTEFGDQDVGEQKNDADVTQAQGNGNLNLSPAIAIGGDAETTNEQGNDNVAKSDIDQKNDVDQSQDATQKQELDQNGSSGGCCTDQSQSGEQKVYGGDQSVEEQKNYADVNQWQGNGNGSFAPAVALGGDATTRNYQGNHNVAKSDIDQENDVDQSQSSKQKQELTQEGGDCCKPTHDCCKPSYGHEPKKEYGRESSPNCSSKCEPKKEYGREHCGCDAEKSGQSGEQKTRFGDQSVGKQKNDADVTQKQGNWNGSFAPAFAFGGHQNSCNSTCTKSVHSLPNGHGGNATTINKQGNGNYAKSDIDQKNDVDQSQDAYQRQTLVTGGEVAYR